MKNLNNILATTIEPLVAKKYGPEFAKIFIYWKMLVGLELSKVCAPVAVDKQDQILTIYVISREKSTQLYFMQEVIIMRINALMERNKMNLRIKKAYIRVKQAA